MSVTSGDTHLKISNNDLFAHKLSGRIDLDLFCIVSLV